MGLGVGKNVKYDPTVTIWEIAEQADGKRSIVAKGTSSTKKVDGSWENFDFTVYFVGHAANKIKAQYPHAAKFDNNSKLRLDILNGDFRIDKVQKKNQNGEPMTFKTNDGRELPLYNKYPSLTIFEFEFHDAAGSNRAPANNAPRDNGFVNIPDSLGSEDYLPFN